jgi:hypothetical protein
MVDPFGRRQVLADRFYAMERQTAFSLLLSA